MNCRKCKKEIPDGSRFCNHCGAKQEPDRKTRRGNGLGTAYKDKNGTWVAEVTIGWDYSDDKPKRKVHKKRGFRTKKEAIEYLPHLRNELPQTDMHIRFNELYQKWLPKYEAKVNSPRAITAAYSYFKPIHYAEFAQIRTEHMQECIDACPCGAPTKRNMKVLASNLFKFAMQMDIVNKNYAQFLECPPDDVKEKTSFSKQQLKLMWDNVDTVPEIRYVLVLCYTGMRIKEMLSAKTENYHPEEGYFITGVKTKAGKNRIITISPKTLPFFSEFGKGKYLFFGFPTERSESFFRGSIFYPVLEKIGIPNTRTDGSKIYTPHSCRHTFATLMKDVDAPATDKQKLIGHSNFEMTAYYTHTDVRSLKAITDAL